MRVGDARRLRRALGILCAVFLLLAPLSARATTWNPSDEFQVTLSNGNLTATCAASTVCGARSTSSKSTGKWYLEFTVTEQGSTIYVGFANSSFDLSGAPSGNGLGRDLNGVGWQTEIGPVNLNNSTIGTAASNTQGDVDSMAIDFDNHLVWFRDAAGNWNNSSTANPATGAGGFSFSGINAGPFFFAFDVINGSGERQIIANFAGPFSESIPSGFSPWDSAAAACPATRALLGVGC
jgi:hypothetical protein